MRHCADKVVYDSKEVADAAALVESSRLGRKLTSYRCGPHQGWHIGRRGHGMGNDTRRQGPYKRRPS